jgi:DNA-binding Lrp family transcriptional regulator
MEDQEQRAYDAVIIGPVLYHETLSNTSKLLYGIIRNLTKLKGYAFAHNQKLAKDLKCTERTIQISIKELEDAGFIKRDLTFTDKDQSIRKIYLHPPMQNTSWEPGRNLHGGHEENYTHNIQSNKQVKKEHTRTSKTIDPQYEQIAIEQQVRKMARWNELINLWKSSESTSTLTNCYNKYFKGLDEEVQESIIKMLKEFGDDLVHLQNEWIITFFKNKMMNGQSIKKAIERNKIHAKPKSKTDDIRRISNF